ncbi:protein of unknown function [Blastococcus saxobsidens DD2]|uniref:Uncharacterized protein n=1 Tax=Blastococcus saxobsidens (strain DD2) TaxID=1146883 RepID=H6RRY6_BLASD|nr:protein of unknown function [Blastococcus saxobsidens DD2]
MVAGAAAAALTAALIGSQRTVMRWRAEAMAWKQAAGKWQQAAEISRGTASRLLHTAERWRQVAEAAGAVYCGATVQESPCEVRPWRGHLCVAAPDHEAEAAEQHHVCDCGHGWREAGTG